MLNEILAAARAARADGRPDAAFPRYEDALPLAATRWGAEGVADLLREIADLRRECGQFDLARETLDLSLTIAELNDLPLAACTARIAMAQVARDRGALGPAERLYRTAREEALELHEAARVASIDLELGDLSRGRGDLEGAERHYRAALSHFSSTDDRLAMADVLTRLGLACMEATDWPAAESALDRALALADGLKVAALLGHIEINRTELYLRARDAARAKACCDHAYALYQQLHSEPGIAAAHRWYGAIHRDGRYQDLAETHLRAAVESARRCGDQIVEAEALGEWAAVHLEAGRYPDAIRALNQGARALTAVAGGRSGAEAERHLDRLEEVYLRVAAAWAETAEASDLFTAGHCERVANNAWLLGRQAGVGGRELTWLRIGAYLHDVGKASIPAAILNKEGSLSEVEWAQMQAHTTEGDAIIASLDFPGDVRSVVRSHHERWDGYGYPDGLAGERIPLGGRIVCLADVYDALTTDRSFRPAFSREEALRIMDSEVGRTFDPRLFLLFREIVLGRVPRRDLRVPRFGGHASAA